MRGRCRGARTDYFSGKQNMGLTVLRSRVQGELTTATDRGYENLRSAMISNQFVADRRPRIILRAENETDVTEAVRFARENPIEVAVRGGGIFGLGFRCAMIAYWIDLGRLNRVAIDVRARRATIGPHGCRERL